MRKGPRGLGLAIIPLLLAFLILLGRPGVASAHAVVARTDPPDPCLAVVSQLPAPAADCAHGVTLAAAPSTVRIWFDEPIQPFGEGIRVTGPDGRRVDRGPARASSSAILVTVDPQQEGTYLVHWQVVSDDTHPTVGAFAFSVGHPSAVADLAPVTGLGAVAPLGLALQTIARWLHFVGFALGFGVLTTLVGPGRAKLAASDEPWPLVNLGILALLLAEPLALLGQTASAGAMLDPDLMSSAFDSSFGRALGSRLGAALALWIIVGFARSGARRAAMAGIGVGALLAVFDGASSHAIGVRPVWLGLGVNAVHLASMGVWLGTVAAIIWARRRKPGGGWEDLVLAFGPRVGVATAALALSGLLLAAEHLAAISDLATTDYGRVLLAKALVVGVALALGLIASRRMVPGRFAWRPSELLALLGALALAGLLVSLPPPR